VINVELWNKGPEMQMVKNLVYDPTRPEMVSEADAGMRLSQKSAPAGVVTFKVSNTSKETIHEMVLVYLKNPTKPLPYMDGENRVDEDKVVTKGEVSELDPGKSGSLTVALQPGRYLLMCNVPGHFESGMWSEFEVSK
jgi:uncharacterized cupredoxin-like copper-binding protein